MPAPIRYLPLCSLLFLAAAEDDCVIRIAVDDDEDEEECADLTEFCPDLQCEVYATDDQGCALCECAPGEGEGEGEGECVSDADCRDGQYCALFEECGCASEGQRPEGPNDEPSEPCVCEVYGVCVDQEPWGCEAALCAPGTYCVEDAAGNPQCIPYDDVYCQSDAECHADEFCNLDYCINPDCENSPDGACEPVCTHGLCEPIRQNDECYADSDCPEGFHCELYDQAPPDCDPSNGQDGCSGLIAPIGTCVENDPNTCPALCGPGHECVISSDGEVQCIPVNDCEALCGPGAICVVFEDGSVGCEIEPRAECVSDEQCGEGLVCNAAEVCLSNPECDANGACTDECWGFCVAPTPTSCQADADCAAGQICELREVCPALCEQGDPNCDAPCFVEGVCVTP